MAVALILDFKGMTLDQYDQILEKMGLTPDGETPPGAIFHWVAESDEGVRVVDVWEDRATFDKFAEEQIGPYSAEVGVTNPPEITQYDLHNTLSR
jgi:hypothetical protein